MAVKCVYRTPRRPGRLVAHRAESPKASVTKQYINLPDSNFLTRQLTDLFADNIQRGGGGGRNPRFFQNTKIPLRLTFYADFLFFLSFRLYKVLTYIIYLNSRIQNNDISLAVKEQKQAFQEIQKTTFLKFFLTMCDFTIFFQIVCEWEDFCSFQREI